MRVFSFGGGVQSTAVLVLAAQGQVQYDAFVFANVGDDSENPATLVYIKEHAQPFAARHGLRLIELRRQRAGRDAPTLLQSLLARGIPIPVHMANGAPGLRNCTTDWKVLVIARWLRQQGATAAQPATVGLGISFDEIERARTDSRIPWERLEYPLLERRLTRAQCVVLVEQAGLPVPPKSSCWFCPMHALNDWRRLRREQPDLFARAVELERLINRRRAAAGKDAVWLTRRAKPLDVVIGEQATLDEALDAVCESGYCMV